MKSQWTGIYIVLYAALLHILWALAMLFTTAEQWATPIAPLFQRFGGPPAVAAWLLGISILALIGKLRWRNTGLTLLCLLPQQWLLMESALASTQAILGSAYADGVLRPRVFIFCDQLPNVLAVICHTAYIVELMVEAGRQWRKRNEP